MPSSGDNRYRKGSLGSHKHFSSVTQSEEPCAAGCRVLDLQRTEHMNQVTLYGTQIHNRVSQLAGLAFRAVPPSQKIGGHLGDLIHEPVKTGSSETSL